MWNVFYSIVVRDCFRIYKLDIVHCVKICEFVFVMFKEMHIIYISLFQC